MIDGLPLFLDRKARVLIVDDEPQNRRLLEVMLEAAGYQIQMAAGGREALAMIKNEPPDLILLDVMMPDMDGYQVAAEVKNGPLTRNIPIIVVTAVDDRAARLRGLTAGAEDFLTKPVDRGELSVRVRNLLRLKAYADYFGQHARSLEAEVAARTAELRTAVEALRVANERTSYALEIANVGIWDCDYSTRTVEWTPVLSSQYGIPHGTFGGTLDAFIALIHPDDLTPALAAIDAGIKSGTDFSVHHRSILPDGRVRWLQNIGRFGLARDGTPLRGVGISQDVTERRLLEAQHTQASKMEAVGQLAAGVAHDFNNLLTVISGFTELITARMQTAQEAREKDARDLEEVTKAAASASALTRQLLAFSRQQVLDPAPLDVNVLITEMSRMLERLIGSGIEVSLVLAPDLALAQADRGQLEQVVMNLVVNARDAMPDGGRVTIETANVDLEDSTFHDETVTAGSFVMVSVTDTGTGMSRETQQRLFEPFFTTKEPGKGTGLGLSTTYGIVKQSKGYIWVYSELGQGTTFKVYLPRATAAATEAVPAAVMASPTTRASETVLLVEDEHAVRVLTRAFLEEAGYTVFEAHNGNDGERMYCRHADAIDVVVTDVVMPGCTGPEMISRLLSARPTLRYLYISGYSAQSQLNLAGDDRGQTIVEKPFTAAQLLHRLREVLDR